MVEFDVALRGVDLNVGITLVSRTCRVAFEQDLAAREKVYLLAFGQLDVLQATEPFDLRDGHGNQFIGPLVAGDEAGRQLALFQFQFKDFPGMTCLGDVAFGLLVEQNSMERSIKVAFFPIVVRNDLQRAVGLLFQGDSSFGCYTHPSRLHLRVHLDQTMRFVSVGHGFQMRLQVLQANSLTLHVGPVDFRNVHRLKPLPFVAELFDAGEFSRRIDPVMFQQLRIQIDLKELFQYGLRHDEDVGDSRLDRGLHLFEKLFQK